MLYFSKLRIVFITIFSLLFVLIASSNFLSFTSSSAFWIKVVEISGLITAASFNSFNFIHPGVYKFIQIFLSHPPNDYEIELNDIAVNGDMIANNNFSS